ncbi:MAG: T9SS type A sorting domain-containing protein [Ignavibacteria bacterium]|nr:T9SS type A sorting domain-containing protein [Ignavibacteria bacterium]
MHQRSFLLAFLIVLLALPARAQLTVKTTAYGTKPGYIDQATLVVEPHGAYVEQSLYLSYSDHNQFAGSSIVEIVHRFRLPANAVVNDLWLWIGDSVMQAIMLDTWRARAIYDSITSSLHDPAFLAKRGDIYELHIFPLVSGSVRKIKLNFITPTRWLGKLGVAELPLQMLSDNNAAKKPLDVLFRVVEPVWGKPSISELPNANFTGLKDTNGYRFQYTRVDDIGVLPGFTLGFTTDFSDGTFFSSSERKNDGAYFQFGFDPGSIFPIQRDSSSKRLLFALDLSGVHYKNFVTLIPRVKQAILSAAKADDSVNVLVAGAGKIQFLNPAWTLGRTDSISALIDRFVASEWGREIAEQRIPYIKYTDDLAPVCWQFPGLEKLATIKNFPSLLEALRDSGKADVVATYNNGTDDRKNNSVELLAKIDSVFIEGGRVLTYYDYNRSPSDEVIASAHIAGLSVRRITEFPAPLTGVAAGNIGKDFTEPFNHYVFNFLEYSPDPQVKVELIDSLGRPYVISKRIHNGLLVVSAIWSFRDDGALKAVIGIPLLGLNAVSCDQQLTGLLQTVKAFHTASPCDRVIVLSNTDTLFEKPDAQAWTASYVADFIPAAPQFTTINLLDGSNFLPRSVTDQQVQYYGCGYLLKTIADATHGRHFETHLYPWNSLCALLDPYSLPTADTLTVSAVADAGAGVVKEIREVEPVPEDPNKARFFIGAATPSDSITFTVRAVFKDSIGERIYTGSRYLSHDSTKMDKIVPSMLGNEHLKDLFKQPKRDTAAIVSMAMRYRLLCDYTALLALEPNDTLHFMKDPFDETKLLDVPEVAGAIDNDSISLSIAPNPFRRETGITLRARNASVVTIAVFDRLGRRVRSITAGESVHGTRLYRWDGGDDLHRRVPAGVYFVQLLAREQTTGVTRTVVRNIVLLD